MPQQNAAAGQAARNGQGQQRQEQTLSQTIMQILTRAMMAYAVMSFFNGGGMFLFTLLSRLCYTGLSQRITHTSQLATVSSEQ